MCRRYFSLLACGFLIAACQPPESPVSQGAGAPDVSVLETPAAAGSFAPNVTTSHDGTLILSWLEPTGEDRHALTFSALEDSSWSKPDTVAVGDNWFANWADFPSVNAIRDDFWVAHWLQSRPAGGYAYDVSAVISTDGGDTWSRPFNPHTDNTDTEHGFVTMFPDGDGVGMVWLDGRKFVNEVTEDVAASGMTLRSATFGQDGKARAEVLLDDLICDCCQTDVTVTPDGPVAVYRNRTEKEIRDIYAIRRTNAGWQSGVPVSNDGWEIPGCPVNGPVIQSNDDHLAVAWFSAPDGAGIVQAAWSPDFGETFSAPVLVADDHPTGHVGATLLENGDLIVSWQRRIEDGHVEFCLRRVSADGSMGQIRVVEEAADIFAISVPQIALYGDELLLAWTESVDDQYSIKTALVPMDYID